MKIPKTIKEIWLSGKKYKGGDTPPPHVIPEHYRKAWSNTSAPSNGEKTEKPKK